MSANVQRLGKLLATASACAFAYMGYQAMQLNERAHHNTHAHGTHAPAEESVAGTAAWFLQLCLVGLVAMVGGVLSRSPLKPIELAEAPPSTGAGVQYRDFLQVGSARLAHTTQQQKRQ
jgi:hypothetical protein